MTKETLELLMAILAVATLGWALYIFYKAAKQSGKTEIKFFKLILAIMLIWLTALSLLAYNDVFNDFSSFPPKPLIPVVSTFILLIGLTFTQPFKHIIRNVSYYEMSLIQCFRIPVELILWGFFIINVLPKQMTFEGGNLDILSGIGGVVVALLIKNKKITTRGIMVYNILGLLLLANILFIAVLSMPTPVRVFMNEPANTIVATFPMYWLPAILVPVALAFHVFSIRKYFIEKQ